MKSHRFNLLFFGSDIFSTRVLSYILNKRLCPIQVVTRAGSLLDNYSHENHIIRHRWPLESKNFNNSDSFNIGLVASFGHLIDENTINQFKYGLFNVHPSLLPKYRGSTPVQTAIKEGVTETGCTIMRIPPIEKFDIGDIVYQEGVIIREREYATSLRDRLADLGAIMVERLLINYDEAIKNAKPQRNEGVSYARKIRPEHGFVNFRTSDSKLIDQKVRAYTGFIDLYTYCLGGLKIRLENMRDPREVESYDLNKLTSTILGRKSVINVEVPAGTMFLHKLRHILCIKCADSNWLAFDFVTPESKPRMSSLEFYNGYLSRLEWKDRRTDEVT